VLLGRQMEIARLVGAIEGAHEGVSTAVIVHGDPGVGKSALLDAVVTRAEGFTVLRAAPLEAESELPFAGLSDVLRPLVPLFDRIPPRQCAALTGALALGDPVPGDRFAAAAATLSLLAAGADEGPLLVAVDDVQWLDAASREALLFAARRLGREGIVVFLASRNRAWVDSSGIARLELGGLAPDAAAALIERSDRVVRPEVRDRLVADTAGNPLALLEALDVMTDAQLDGSEQFDAPTATSAAIEQGLVGRLDSLPIEVKRALLVAAASDSGDAREIGSALAELGLALSDFDAAKGFVSVSKDRVAFRHPLVRSAVYQLHEPAARRTAHRAIAVALGPDEGARVVWQLAAAAEAPDEDVASRLDEVAESAVARGGHASAALTFESAARLSPTDEGRMRRTIAAARAHWLGGEPRRADQMLERLLPQVGDPVVRADVQLLRSVVRMYSVPLTETYAMLNDEVDRASPIDEGRLGALLCRAALCSGMAGDVTHAVEAANRAANIARASGGMAAVLSDTVLAWGLLLAGRVDEAKALRDPLLPMFRELDPVGDAGDLISFVAPGLTWTEDFETAGALLHSVIEAARVASAPSLLPLPLAFLSEVELRRDRIPAAYAAASESVRLAQDTDQTISSSFAMLTLARVEAVLGHEAPCRELVTRARDLARHSGTRPMEVYSEAVLGFLELSLGRLSEAHSHATECARLEAECGVALPTVVPSRPDLIEAAVHLGRPDDARSALEQFEERGRATGLRWVAATTARGRGLLADELDYEDAFANALRLHGDGPSFERARTELCLGMRRRRSRRRGDARLALNSALAIFEALGAAPWAAQARAELRATGAELAPAPDNMLQLLTPQEIQVALAVAEGRTNKEVASALFLSPKTIEYHLGNVYRKLGLRSRSELAHQVTKLG
jgi:DNA-binding CsgD family transcriptional regulator